MKEEIQQWDKNKIDIKKINNLITEQNQNLFNLQDLKWIHNLKRNTILKRRNLKDREKINLFFFIKN